MLNYARVIKKASTQFCKAAATSTLHDDDAFLDVSLAAAQDRQGESSRNDKR